MFKSDPITYDSRNVLFDEQGQAETNKFTVVFHTTCVDVMEREQIYITDNSTRRELLIPLSTLKAIAADIPKYFDEPEPALRDRITRLFMQVVGLERKALGFPARVPKPVKEEVE